MPEKALIKPPVPYAGGKFHIVEWVIEHFPPHKVYVDVFGGAASVLLNKPRSDIEIYNDAFGDVVNLFRVLRTRSLRERLIEQLHLTPWSREEFETCVAEQYNPTADAVERARRYMVIARQGWAGFGAAGNHMTKGRWNTDINADTGNSSRMNTWTTMDDNLRLVGERFRGVVIENRDFEEIIAKHNNQNILLYIDPPYVHDSRKYKETYRHEITDDRHIMLSHILHKTKCMVAVSGYNSELYDDLYHDWHKYETESYASGMDPADHKKGKRIEAIWLNKVADKSVALQPSLF